MDPDRRALLESIAFGSDADVRPADRLRALDVLREFDEGPDFDHTIRRELAALTSREIDMQLDALCGEEMMRSVLAKEGRFPRMEQVLAQRRRYQKNAAARTIR
jgi:hypothetical protein